MAACGKNRLLNSAVRIAGNESLSYNSRLKSIARLVNESFQAESTAIYILDDERRNLSQKIPHAGDDEILACSIPVGEGVAGACVGRKVICRKGKNSLHEDEFHAGTEQDIFCVPVPPDKKIRGAISLGLREDKEVTEDDVELLQDISAVLGTLVQGRNITEWSDKRVQNLITLNEIVKIVNKPVPFKVLPSFILNACHHQTNSCCTVLRILEYDGASPLVLRRCRRKFHPELTALLKVEAQYAAKAIATGTPLLATDIISDEELPPSCICVPLRYESIVIGTMTFFGKMLDDGRFCNFNEEDRELFEGMSTPIATALGMAVNDRQTELLAFENARKLKEISILYRISNVMHSTIKLNELIYLALNALVSGESPIFERAMLFLINERSGVIQGMLGATNETSRGIIKNASESGDPASSRWEISGENLANQQESVFSRKVKETRLPLDKDLNVSSRAIIEKKLIHIRDAAKEKQIDRDFVKKFGITEFAAAPLMAREEVLGMVIADNPQTDKHITGDDLRFLQLLLNQAGTSIENAMLYSRIEDAHRDYREVQQRLIQGEKLAAIGEMAASIAHELKGPIVSIGGLAKRLERKIPPEATEWKYAETIAREAARLEKMLTDTLHFSRKATITCEPCNINVIIEESLAIVADSLEERNIRVKLRSHPDIGPFHGDFLQLKQVFINLFANAAEAMKYGGTLSITVFPARLDGADALYVKVLDTGGGIPLEILSNIFNPFFTTKEHGTGLGLPIAHRIVANHGGKILVYNRLGVGAQFKVVLPLEPKIPSLE